MLNAPQDKVNVSAAYEPVMREIGFSPGFVFSHPDVKVWRKLDDRENCTLDLNLPDGRLVRWHIKRYPPLAGFTTMAEDEAQGYRALEVEKIPAARLVAWGKLADRRSFLITEDLAGFSAADKVVEAGTPFDAIMVPIADTAARLHAAGLHHRDMYLCHFFVKVEGPAVDVRLIDAARVRRLPGILTRQRWIVKDLAQLWYSTMKLPITDVHRDSMLARYSRQRMLTNDDGLKRSIELKVRWIAAHDRKLNEREPQRNISIPDDQE